MTVSYIAYSYLRNYLLLFTVSVHRGRRGKGGVWRGGGRGHIEGDAFSEGGGVHGGGGGVEASGNTEGLLERDRERERENSNSKILFYKDCI